MFGSCAQAAKVRERGGKYNELGRTRLWSPNMSLLPDAAQTSSWKSRVVFFGFAKRRYEITLYKLWFLMKFFFSY